MVKRTLFLSICPFLIGLTVACQPIMLPARPAAGDTAATTTVTTTATLTETAVVSATVALTDTAANAVATGPLVTVVVSSLRVRSGPGTDYTVVGAAAQGEQYPITGQAYSCQWYQITHPQLGEAWLSGGAQYVTSNASCDQISEVTIPALPTAAPTVAAPEPTEPAAPTAPAATPAPAQEQPTNTPAPTATTPPAQSGVDPFPSELGCLLLQNQLGPELTFTFTGDNYNDTVKVNAEQDVPYCLPPGHYRVTVDAPPPWSVINEEFTLKAGDRAYFPIRPQE